MNPITLNTNVLNILTVSGSLPNTTQPNTAVIDALSSSNRKPYSELVSAAPNTIDYAVLRVVNQIAVSHPNILSDTDQKKAVLREYAKAVYPNDQKNQDLLFDRLANTFSSYEDALTKRFVVPPTSSGAVTPAQPIAVNPPNNGSGENSGATPGPTSTECGTLASNPGYATCLDNLGRNTSGATSDVNQGDGSSESGKTKIEPPKPPPNSTRIESWVLSWEPTQKVGIVKIPVQKIISSLAGEGKGEDLNYFKDVIFFDVTALADFEGVNGRIFLPMSTNKLVALKEFSTTRKNIQQVEITHGSRYFQVFTENFPEFSMTIDVVRFADVAKKVKMFFDNVMKRISETARYSGGLYVYDIIGEEIPSFDITTLSSKLKSGVLTKYRLLPRSIRSQASSEDPNIVKFSIEGIIVEWEKQVESLIPNSAGSTIRQARTRNESVPAEVTIVGLNERYADTFLLNATASLPNTNPENKTEIQLAYNNTLFKVSELQTFFSDAEVNFWELKNYNGKENGVLYIDNKEFTDKFTKNGMYSIYKDTLDLYKNLSVYLSQRYNNDPSNNRPLFNNKDAYQNTLIALWKDMGIPQDQQTRMRKGFEKYINDVASTRKCNRNDRLSICVKFFEKFEIPKTSSN